MDIVSFVILHYKDLQTTDICVRSILRMKQRERIRIVIVDNDIHEPLEKRKVLQEKYESYPEITVLPIWENGGFSYANNQGYIYAREQLQSSFILVLNNDIEFMQQDFLEKMDGIYQENPCAVLAPDVIRNSTGEHQNPLDLRVRTASEAEYTRKMNLWALKYYNILYPLIYWKNKRNEAKIFRQRKQNEKYYRFMHDNIVPFGALLIYTPQYVRNEIRAFWPETNFYYEEYLLARRCQKNGYRILYTPDIVALHESGVATRKSYGSEKKRTRFVMERVAAACEVYLRYLKTLE